MYKILFDLTQEYYWPSLKPIYDEYSDDNRYQLFIKIGKNQKRFLYIFLISQKKKIERGFIKSGYRITDKMSDFDVVFCGAPLHNPTEYGKALLCNVDHGPGIKTLRYRHFLKQPDIHYYCFIEGKYRIDKFKHYGLDQIETIYDVGLPKLDILFNGTYNKTELIQSYNLDPDKKIILYAPSYKPTSIFSMGKKVVELSLKYNLIIKLHPYSWSGKYASHSQHKIFEKLAKEYPNFLLVSKNDHNILPYLYIADTMISDGSSVINEFLALERCGIIIDLPDQNLKHHDGESLLADRSSEWLKNSFIHITEESDLEMAVEEALNPSQERLEKIKKDKNYIFTYTDSISAKRVKDTVDTLLLKGTHL